MDEPLTKNPNYYPDNTLQLPNFTLTDPIAWGKEHSDIFKKLIIHHFMFRYGMDLDDEKVPVIFGSEMTLASIYFRAFRDFVTYLEGHRVSVLEALEKAAP